MDIRKVKLAKSETVVEWVTHQGTAEIEHRLKTTELPAPEFLAALQAFQAPVLKLLELPPAYGAGLTVSGVTWVQQDDGNWGLVVTSLKSLAEANAPLVLNTPYLPADAEGEVPLLPQAMVDAADGLAMEAKAFISGKRAQGDLFEKKPDAAVQRAVERLRPKAGSSFEAVEITTNGRGVRLEKDRTVEIVR